MNAYYTVRPCCASDSIALATPTITLKIKYIAKATSSSSNLHVINEDRFLLSFRHRCWRWSWLVLITWRIRLIFLDELYPLKFHQGRADVLQLNHRPIINHKPIINHRDLHLRTGQKHQTFGRIHKKTGCAHGCVLVLPLLKNAIESLLELVL